MVKYVALLRGIGPTNPNMRNKKLRETFERLGFKNIRTVISTGNVLFESPSKSMTALETKIEKAFPKYLGFQSTTLIRNKEEIERLIKRDPYQGRKHGPQNYTLVAFLKEHSGKLRTFPRRGPGFRIPAVYRKELCAIVDLKNTRTPDLMRLLEQELGKAIITRTWNTVLKIGAALEK